METYLFILTQIIYLIFLIVLVNTAKKHLFSSEHNKILNINSENIFIPENPTYNELYIHHLNKNINSNNSKINKYEAIAILPYSDKLISKNGLWDLFLSFYKDRIFLENYLPKTFDLNNFNEKKDFEKYIYSKINKKKLSKIDKKNLPKIFFLKKNIENKKGIKIFRIKEMEDVIELYNNYFEDNYVLVQELADNLYLNQNRTQILRVYIFFYKYENMLSLYKYNWSKLLYPDADYDLMNDNSLISLSQENIKENLKYDIDFTLNENNDLGNKINKILELLFDCSKTLLLDNSVLPNHKLFQHFGLDFILTNNGPKLLEINKNPILTSYYLKNKKKEMKMKGLMITEMYDIVKNGFLKNNYNYKLIKKIDIKKSIIK